MSRSASYTDTLELVPSGYTGLTSLTTTSSYPIGNAYANTSNTTYARLSLSTSTTGYLYLTFDTSALPSGCTIDSVTAKCRVRVSSTSRVTSTVCQLYSGTTAKGSNATFASTSSTNVVTLTPGTWTLAELADLRMRIGGTGSSSSQSKYIYLYGAEVTIAYSVDGTEYEVTITNSTSATVTADQWVMGGENATVMADTLDGITVTDNGTDVTSSFVQAQDGSVSAVPGSVTTSGISSGSSYMEYAVGHSAESPSSSGTSSNAYASSGSTGYAEYSFDLSELPSTATIKSVSVSAYGHRESSTTDSTHVSQVQLYSGSTAKGEAEDFTSTSNQIITVSDPGTWTYAELQSAKLRHTVGYYGGLVLGVTWTVTYEQDGYIYTIANIAADHAIVVANSSTGPVMFVKQNGSWVAVTKVYRKVNGTWTEISPSTLDSTANYVKA